jgi:hypothetical protein
MLYAGMKFRYLSVRPGRPIYKEAVGAAPESPGRLPIMSFEPVSRSKDKLPRMHFGNFRCHTVFIRKALPRPHIAPAHQISTSYNPPFTISSSYPWTHFGTLRQLQLCISRALASALYNNSVNDDSDKGARNFQAPAEQKPLDRWLLPRMTARMIIGTRNL